MISKSVYTEKRSKKKPFKSSSKEEKSTVIL